VTLIRTSIDESAENSQWDQFVTSSDMGNFYQTCAWAQVKQTQGWKTMRVIVKLPSESICGGAQAQYKKCLGFITVILLPKGPLFDLEHPEMALSILDEFTRHFKNSPFLLFVQPEDDCWDFQNRLLQLGFDASLCVDLEETATIVIDVSKDQEDILRQIKKKKRPKLHQSDSRGIVCYETTRKDDLEIFYSLHKRIAEKRNFAIQCKPFFDALWDQFVPEGWCHLFIATIKEQPVASLLVITYKDTLHFYRIGWAEGYNNYYPNEGIYWYALKWANEHHYHWVDFGGIDHEAAVAVLNGAEWPEWVNHSYNAFKLHVSEQVVLSPGTVGYCNPKVFSDLIRWTSCHPVFYGVLKKAYTVFRRR
jgi:peptidoglycan pentaglycine glycine transferase (the first glycine)